jgi:nucleoside-diphosphate-sugar epimerase
MGEADEVMQRILVTGGLGQIGAELVPALRERFGADNVVASDIRMPPSGSLSNGPFEYVDCQHLHEIESVIRRYAIDTIYHLGAVLSATAETKPRVAWDVNMGGIYRVLEAARAHGCAVFHPSSIGAFGPTTPPDGTPQDTLQRPITMYGITKVAAELLCDYYASRFRIDTRGVRLPGLVSYAAPPGGGTTDYAVEIFHHAVRHRRYTCYLRPDTRLDLMYMPDAVRAMIEVMEADPSHLRHRNAYNIAAMSVTPAMLAKAILRHLPDLVIDYEVDPVRQAIADSWPNSIDDSAARADWGWKPRYDLDAMTADMLEHIGQRTPLAAAT